jgi:hypothetical protein
MANDDVPEERFSRVNTVQPSRTKSSILGGKHTLAKLNVKQFSAAFTILLQLKARYFIGQS